MNESKTYFAYGTLLGTAAMRHYCPSANPVAVARYDGHQLEFRQYSDDPDRCGCNLRSTPGEDMYGVVYDVSEEDMAALDSASGVPSGWFLRKPISVTTIGGTTMETTTYFLTDPGPTMSPAADYLGLVDA